MSDINSNFWEEKEDTFDLRLFFLKYLRYWYWFIISFVLAGTVSYLYLRYTTPIYQLNAILLIKDEKKGGMGQIDALKDLELFSGNKIVENEMEVLKSRSLIEKVVDDLNLTVNYFQEGKIRRDEEMFGTSPIWVQTGKLNTLAYEESIFIKVLDKQKYEILDEDEKSKGVFTFSQNIKSDYGVFRVFLNDSLYRKVNDLIKVKFFSKELLIQKYQKDLLVELMNQKSSVLKLSIEDAVPNKGKAFLAKLLEAYTFSALSDKNHEATNTLQFIDERLKLITGELGDVEKDVETYKSSQGITDLSLEANLFLEKVKETDGKLNEVDIQLKVLDGVDAYLRSSQTGIAPATLMVSDPVLTGLLAKLNELEIQKEKYARTTQAGNPLLETVNTQIANTKGAIRENIANQKQGFVITRNSLKTQNNKFESAIRTIPHKEREFVSIKRQQGIKESLFLLLLQKREETAITYASTVTDSRVVDDPYSSPKPIKPQPNIIYLMGLLIGLILPSTVINLRNLLNDKIQSRKEIESETGLPIFGEIGKKPNDLKDNIIDIKSNSFIAEQFRILRTNLQYTAGGVKSDIGKVILLTSSTSGEGKSFVSINLAASIALLGKKVIVLELDLRKPKVSSYLGVSRERGISNYLIGQVDIENLILPTTLSENMFVLPSGPIPPNPAELLANGKVEELLNTLKQKYDYVLLDTPPVGLVTDAIILGAYCDTAFYLIRHEYTPKSNLRILVDLKKSQKIKSLNIIFNGVDYKNSQEYRYGYGNGYGYGKGYH
ncbi:MAG: polysaccharide biosynthesis tyrosine autokinase [Bacteroidota bacterium]